MPPDPLVFASRHQVPGPPMPPPPPMPLVEVSPVAPTQTVPPLGVVIGVQLGPVVVADVLAAELLDVVAAELVDVVLVEVEVEVLVEVVLEEELELLDPVGPVGPPPFDCWHFSSALRTSVLKPWTSWLRSWELIAVGRSSKSIRADSIAALVTAQSPATTPAWM